MKRVNSWLFVGVIIVITMATISAEIHRARNAPTYQYKLRKPHAGQVLRRVDPEAEDLDSKAAASDSWNSWFEEIVWGHSRKIWILSFVSSCMVGLTGIVPLIVIPANCGFDIKSEVSSGRMKALLSFAVGGLLGDVFLHLLPEAWSHVNDYQDKLTGYRHIGLWFLGGLLSFFFVEKLFGGDEEDEDEDEENEENEKEEEKVIEDGKKEESLDESSDNDEKMRFSKLIMRERKDTNPSKSSKDLRHRKTTTSKEDVGDENGGVNGEEVDEKVAEGKEKSSHVMSGLNGPVVVQDDEEEVGKKEEKNEKPEKIKVSGWLNLVANIVDNFTHGLAVAGSFCISPKMGLLTTFAILLHEIPHEIGDFAILLRAGFNRWRAAKAQLMTASGGVIGAMIALSAESVKIAGDSTAWILPFTAGGFVNIALVTITPDLTKEKATKQSFKQLALVIAGVLVMGLVTIMVD